MKRLPIILICLIAVLLLSAYAAFPAVLRMLESTLANRLGLDELRLVVRRPDLNSIRLDAIDATAGTVEVEIRNGTLTWHWAGLLQARADSLEIADARIRVREDPADTGITLPTLPMAFSELPVSRAAVASLELDIPHLALHGTGQARFDNQRLLLSMTATTPLAEDPLELDLSLQTPADGREIALDAVLIESGQPPLLEMQATEQHNELHVTMDYRLYGFTLARLAQTLELPAGDGLLEGALRAQIGLTPERNPDWQTLTAQGPFSLAWSSRDQTFDISKLSGNLQYASGGVSGYLIGAATYQADDDRLSVSIPEALHVRADSQRLSLAKGIRIDARSSDLSLLAVLREIEVDLGGALGIKGLADISSTSPQPVTGTLQFHLGSTDSMTTHEADVSFTGTTTLTPYPAQPVPVDLRGHYHFAARRLSADLTLTTGLLKNLPLQLVYDTESASGTLTAKHDLSWQTPLIAGILPGWQAPFDFDRGSLALRLNLRLAEAIDGDAILSLTDTTLRYGNYLANRTSAAISANLGPEGMNLGPSTLTIGSIDVGFPLTDIRAGLSGGADALHISDLSARLLGGLASAAPFDYRIDTATADLDLSLSDLDLAHVLALEGTNITGSGRLDGLLPIRVRGGEASVSGGRIEARAPGGRIQLAPSLANAITQPGLDIALKALEDFEFTALRATADYGTTGDLTLGLRLEGRNARIEGGRPIHYNLNISENIPTLLESLRLSETFTRSIERRALQ